MPSLFAARLSSLARQHPLACHRRLLSSLAHQHPHWPAVVVAAAALAVRSPPSPSRQPPSSSASTIIVATEPSSPSPPPPISCFMGEVPFHIQRNPFGIKQKQKKSILFTAQLLRKTNLAEIFSDARLGTIAHKNKKRITAVTQCQYCSVNTVV